MNKASVLSGNQMDIEARFGFKSGRFTSTNTWLAFLGGAILAGAWYGLMKLLQAYSPNLIYFYEPFLRHGNLTTVIPATFLFFTSCMILLVKGSKIRHQQKAFEWAVVPAQHEFVLTEKTARAVLERIHTIVSDPKDFILLNRIERALSNLHHLGQVSEVSSVLRGQAVDDENAIGGSFTLLHGFVWAMPVLGFIGTVQGLSTAVGGFGAVLAASSSLDQIKNALKGVTGGLSTGFEATLVALIFSLIVQIWITFRQRQELSLLDECSEYCQAYVISKLRLNTKDESSTS